MDERLQSLLDSVQKTAVTAANSASDAAYAVGKKTSQLLSVGKLNIQIVDLKAEINTQLREVGELIYATHTGDPTDSDVLLNQLQSIDALYDRLHELSARLAAEKGGSVCPVCGAAGETGDVFCRECGSRL